MGIENMLGSMGLNKKKEKSPYDDLRSDYEEQIGEGDPSEEINVELEQDNETAVKDNNYILGKNEELVIPEHPGSLN